MLQNILILLSLSAGANFPTPEELALQEQSAGKRVMKEDAPTTGTSLKRKVAESAIPFNKRYSELTSEEKECVRDVYENMPEDDEPPYPINGLTNIYRMISKAQQTLSLRGRLTIVADISSKGEAESISVYESPDPEMTRVVSLVLIEEKYKPAICSGQACRMQYVFRVNFSRQ